MKKIFIALAICFSASASFAAQKNEFTAGGFREKEASDKAMRLCRKLGYIDCKYISTRMISGEFEVKVKGTTRQDPSQAGELFTASHYDEQAAYDEAMRECDKKRYVDCKYFSTRMVSGQFEVEVQGKKKQSPPPRPGAEIFTVSRYDEQAAYQEAMRLCRKGYIDCKYISTRMVSSQFEVEVKGITKQDPSQTGEIFTASRSDEQAAYQEAVRLCRKGYIDCKYISTRMVSGQFEVEVKGTKR